MLMRTLTALWLLATSVAAAQKDDAPAFTYDSRQFLLHGEPYIMIGGEMDPQRIPPTFWRDRLVKAKAMGLSTIFIYTFWNDLEPKQGVWTSDQPENDIAKFAELADEEGLKIVLRPGPYVCGEREWGGYPAWLAQVPGIVIRDNNKPFLDASRNYIANLAKDLKHLQVTEGGPILMVQVENEYGSFGEDMDYKIAMRDMVKDYFDIPLYTTDGGGKDYLEGGYIPGVLAEPDGDPKSAFEARHATITDPTSLGPLVVGEFYMVRSDKWGPTVPHYTTVGNDKLVKQYIKDIDFVLSGNNSFSFYMWHGGSNFGFSTGALWENRTIPWTPSYDHGSPLDESGRTNSLYFSIRDEIKRHVPEGSIPEPPANVPMLEIPKFDVHAKANMLQLPSKKKAFCSAPVTMEKFGQAYGFVLYEHHVTEEVSGVLQPGDRARDRVLVYGNGTRKGIIDSFYKQPAEVQLELQPGDKLQLLVENMGRVNYWNRWSNTPNMLRDPYKGIKGAVTVGGQTLRGWASASLPLSELEDFDSEVPADLEAGAAAPVFYEGSFSVGGSDDDDPAKRDTYIKVSGGVRGVVWVNGFNLGRYWVAGPQRSLYLPGSVVKGGQMNRITILELEPRSDKLSVQGVAETEWGNSPDPDAP